MQGGALRPSSPDPRTDMRQIFQRNRPLRAFGRRHNLRTQVVIDPCSKPPLLSRKRTQAAAAAQRAFLLQFLAQPPMAIAHVLDGLSLVNTTIRIGCDVGNAHINANNVDYGLWFFRHNFRRGKQVPFAANKHEIAFATAMCKQRTLAFTANERNSLASLNCPDRDRISFVGKNAVIEGDRATSLECALCVAIQRIGIRNFGNATHDKLRRHVKGCFGVLIRQLVDAKLLELAYIPRSRAYSITSRMRGF